MEEKLLYVVLGAFAALVSVLVFLLMREVWLQTVLTHWRRWRYRGVKIAGGWKGLGNASPPTPGEWSEIGLVLAQSTREVQGLLALRRCSTGTCVETRLPVAGTISDGWVTLFASAEGASPPLLASALLKVDAGGSSLNGQLLYCEAEANTVESLQVSVHRAQTMTLPRLRALSEPGLSSALVQP